MKKITLLSIFILCTGMGSIVSAADILLIGEPTSASSISIADFLISEGHSVTQEDRFDGPGNANDFDLVIIEPNSNSNGYNNNGLIPDRASQWNSVSAPIICMNPFFYTANNWGWSTNPNIGNISSASVMIPYDLPDHPFVAGLIEPVGDITTDTEVRAIRPARANILSSGVSLIARTQSGFNMALYTIDEGTILSDPDNTAAGAIRIAWPLAGDSGVNVWDFINSNGEQIMRNMIAAVVPAPPVSPRVTSVTIEPSSGDFLVSFLPAGIDYVLTSSDDLSSPFEEVTSAILENGNATFRVSAPNLSPNRDFFRVEEAP